MQWAAPQYHYLVAGASEGTRQNCTHLPAAARDHDFLAARQLKVS
jgi:hypothetical protein